jgi:hypothetical protein
MARRPLLTDEERRLFFGIPDEPDGLARHYSFTRSDRDLVADRRGAANQLGFAIQLALLRHSGMALAQMEEPVGVLVEWSAAQLGIPAAAFADYAARPQTMTDHALLLARTLGLRAPSNADLPFMIETAAQSAWSTDRGAPVVAGVIAALRTAKIILPAPTVIERTAIAGRARARKRAADALLADLSPAQLGKLDALLILDPALEATPLAWLRNTPTAPKPNHVRTLLDRLRRVREIGVPPEAAGRIHEDRFQRFIREGRISDAHQMGRYTVQRRRSILAASVIDLEARLTDAALDMADKKRQGTKSREVRHRRCREALWGFSRGVGGRPVLFEITKDTRASVQDWAWRGSRLAF